MKKKKTLILIVSLFFILSIIIVVLNCNNKISEDYIARVSSGSGEITYNLYIYKNSNKYKYVEATTMTKSWGSSDTTTKVTKRKNISKSNLVKILEDTKKYSFVTLPDSDMIYTKDEYIDILLNED